MLNVSMSEGWIVYTVMNQWVGQEAAFSDADDREE